MSKSAMMILKWMLYGAFLLLTSIFGLWLVQESWIWMDFGILVAMIIWMWLIYRPSNKRSNRESTR